MPGLLSGRSMSFSKFMSYIEMLPSCQTFVTSMNLQHVDETSGAGDRVLPDRGIVVASLSTGTLEERDEWSTGEVQQLSPGGTPDLCRKIRYLQSDQGKGSGQDDELPVSEQFEEEFSRHEQAEA